MYVCRGNEKQNDGGVAEKEAVIHQEITGIKGMWFHQQAGGDELLPGGQVEFRIKLSFEADMGSAFPFSIINPTVKTGGPPGQTHLWRSNWDIGIL